MKPKALVCGAGGFIGNHLVSALKSDGFYVRGRVSDNRLIAERLGWSPGSDLESGLLKAYAWIKAQIEAQSQTEVQNAS